MRSDGDCRGPRVVRNYSSHLKLIAELDVPSGRIERAACRTNSLPDSIFQTTAQALCLEDYRSQ